MQKLKSIKLYFFSILRLFFLSFRNFYFKSKFYNKKLITFYPDRIFYNPSSYLSASLITIGKDFYKINDVAPNLLWKINAKERQKFEGLHSFLWLTKLDRKSSKNITKTIVKIITKCKKRCGGNRILLIIRTIGFSLRVAHT